MGETHRVGGILKATFPSCIVVVGLGYTGLPLASAFGRLTRTIGYDIDILRIAELKNGYDRNGELSPEQVAVPFLEFTHDASCLKEASFIVVGVPTPVDWQKRPDLGPLIEASKTIGQNLSHGAVVVYESTVYPGATEEVVLPILEEESGLAAGSDFKIGYSPERINPGDQAHDLEQVVKVVAAQDPMTAALLAQVYGMITKAGTHVAPDIRTAEAAKVIENVQRDLNIGLMNELCMLFHRMGISTKDVLAAAGTKWNFMPFQPGLVGGHCIPVDPYYLTYKAQELNFHPEVILAGRRTNDKMSAYISDETIKLLNEAGKVVVGSKVLVLGVTFKENVSDIRNTLVLDLVRQLQSHGVDVNVHDPLADEEKLRQLNLQPISDPFTCSPPESYDAIVLAVPHRRFRETDLDSYLALLNGKTGPGIIVDIKGVLPIPPLDKDGNHRVLVWTL